MAVSSAATNEITAVLSSAAVEVAVVQVAETPARVPERVGSSVRAGMGGNELPPPSGL
jgi:hypothetical protein